MVISCIVGWAILKSSIKYIVVLSIVSSKRRFSMSKTNIQIVEEYIDEVANQKHFDRIFEYCTEDCVLHVEPYVGLGLNFDSRSGDKIILFNIMPTGPAAGALQEGDELVRVTDGAKTW